MLNRTDTPTIRNAIHKRLGKERGVTICEIKFWQHEDCISVGVLATVDEGPITRSLFDLPPEWDIRHLWDEIDEVAEQMKAARKAHFGRGGLPMAKPEVQLAGTGLRGRWAKYG